MSDAVSPCRDFRASVSVGPSPEKSERPARRTAGLAADDEQNRMEFQMPVLGSGSRTEMRPSAIATGQSAPQAPAALAGALAAGGITIIAITQDIAS